MNVWLILLFCFFLCFISITYAYCYSTPDKAVIHHTASHDVTVKEIDRWHKEKGWDGIGYHFVIRADGEVCEGRKLKKIGAHAKGRNHYVGIALTGYDIFTPAQIKSLITLLIELDITHIESHHKQCPGPGLDMNMIRKEIRRRSK